MKRSSSQSWREIMKAQSVRGSDAIECRVAINNGSAINFYELNTVYVIKFNDVSSQVAIEPRRLDKLVKALVHGWTRKLNLSPIVRNTHSSLSSSLPNGKQCNHSFERGSLVDCMPSEIAAECECFIVFVEALGEIMSFNCGILDKRSKPFLRDVELQSAQSHSS